ncbi:uncharacterized protein ACA1_206350 [Acanthamoeba castellanii str. Neff]|uniref:Large ribosomal subunit protein mL52 n=1 Tax=Acanthamoeba castellanii (strain ATCC 30010 / Neff) TaxID=1257118 RepID=L8GZD7_ACACF|nr:uncharacterized protein ACA1_206350 [Acanthamoeba castellanii str. Neff]ELR17898.1 hypothetical protein ACA1_206350 [Acanthamoeba castellanii str. Neff]
MSNGVVANAIWRRSMAGGMRGFASASLPMRAGQRVRLMQGVGRSGNEDGAFHDAPDWEYAAPPSRKQIVWMTKRQETEERIQRLREEVMEMEQKELERQSFYKDE